VAKVSYDAKTAAQAKLPDDQKATLDGEVATLKKAYEDAKKVSDPVKKTFDDWTVATWTPLEEAFNSAKKTMEENETFK